VSPPVIHFDYWQSSPPQLLLDALKRGEEPDRRTAVNAGWRLQLRERLAQARTREATSTERVLSPAAVAAADRFGARIEVHADDYARLVAADGSTWVFRTDHRFWIWIDRVTDDDLEYAVAWFRLPAGSAEPVLAAILGHAWCTATAVAVPLPPPTTIEVVEGRNWQWEWTDGSGSHQVRNWETPELARRYAPFARWSVEQVVAHFAAASPMRG
jgi:hypothetical protein